MSRRRESEQCSQGCNEAITKKSRIKYETAKDMRTLYLNWWGPDENNYISAQNQLIDVVNGIKNLTFSDNTEELLTNFGTVPIKKCIFVGRHPKCDIVIKDRMVSRIQCVIIVANEKIVVLDWWSGPGTYTIKRGDKTKESTNSVSDNRNILEFGKNETFQLKFHDIDLIIGRNECMICYDYPKSIRLKCGSF